MSHITIFAYTNPVSPACEDEFNRWYDEVHVPELIVPGTRAVRRYRISQMNTQFPAQRYLATFEVEQSQGAVEAMTRAAAVSTPTQSMRMEDRIFHFYEPIFALDLP